jgi:hypothetical protein
MKLEVQVVYCDEYVEEVTYSSESSAECDLEEKETCWLINLHKCQVASN